MKKINTLGEIAAEGVSLVMFTMPSCGPCKMMKPGLEKIEEKNPHFSFYEIDAEDNLDLARSLGIKSTPTLIYLKDQEEVKRVTGFQPVPTVIEALNTLC